jgi:hypothetical protein
VGWCKLVGGGDKNENGNSTYLAIAGCILGE